MSIHFKAKQTLYMYKFKEVTYGSEAASARLCKNTFVV